MTAEQLQKNKEEYIKKVRGISREGTDIEGLILMLEQSDFFNAPATANAYRAYDGGLCEQALDRALELDRICSYSSYAPVSADSRAIVALFADLGEINYFEPYSINKKVYKPTGSKSDALGNFDWESEKGWKVRDPQNRFLFGTLGQNAERILTNYIPLTTEESAAIIHLHGERENPNFNLSGIYFTYPLSVLLNAADKFAAFINTREDAIPF